MIRWLQTVLPPSWVLGLFALAHLFFDAIGERWIAYGLGFGLGLVVRARAEPLAVVGLEAVLYLVAYWGLRRSFLQFQRDAGKWQSVYLRILLQER